MRHAVEGLDPYGDLPYLTPMPGSPTARLEARLPADIMAALKRAAEIEGRTLTDFVVAAAHAAARHTIGEAELIRLSAEDSRCFANAILAPPAPAPALGRAFGHHGRLVSSSEA